jgi:nucleotide-binding universal stress UspA family protein
LVTPEGLRETRRLLVAYDGSDESRKALHAGLELARVFGAPIILLTVGHQAADSTAARVLEQAKVEAANAKIVAEARLGTGHPRR